MLTLIAFLPILIIYLLPPTKAGYVISVLIVICKFYIPDAVPMIDEVTALCVLGMKLGILGDRKTLQTYEKDNVMDITDMCDIEDESVKNDEEKTKNIDWDIGNDM